MSMVNGDVNFCEWIQTKQRSNINYDDFFNPLTKAQSKNYNYLKLAGKKMTQVKKEKKFKFSVGNPNPNCFPYADVFIRSKNNSSFKVTGKQLDDSLSYINDDGYPPFLVMLKNYQDRFHGKQDWNKKGLITVPGSLNGLHQVVGMCVSPGDPIVIQTPLYTGMIANLKHLNLDFIEVESDPDTGISPRNLAYVLFQRQKKNLPMPKIFYLNPTGSNPTGELISTETKKELYKIACYFNLLILEDDPYYLLTFDNSAKMPTSFLSLDIENRVIRIDSFSKTMGAGFRIGYITAAKEIITMLNCVTASSCVCPPFSQVIAYETLNMMGFDGFMEHINFIRGFYHRKCSILVKCLEKHMKELATWKVPQAAMFVWLTMKNIDHVPEDFIDKCIENGLFIVPGFPFYCSKRLSPCIRLSFSMVQDEEIEEGVEILAQLVKNELLKTQ